VPQPPLSTDPDGPAPKRPRWKDPFVIAFVLGVLVLTALPVLQGRFLSAPPPMHALPGWSLVELSDGGAVGSASLAGKVVLLQLATSPCDGPCVERQDLFANAVRHTEDLGERVQVVTVVMPGAERALEGRGGGRWHLASGDDAQLAVLLGALRAAWWQWAMTDAGATTLDFSRLPAVVVVDQLNQVRGFWRDDAPGRGNAINAARLLAKRPDLVTQLPAP
jgi:hypothetical protein